MQFLRPAVTAQTNASPDPVFASVGRRQCRSSADQGRIHSSPGADACAASGREVGFPVGACFGFDQASRCGNWQHFRNDAHSDRCCRFDFERSTAVREESQVLWKMRFSGGSRSSWATQVVREVASKCFLCDRTRVHSAGIHSGSPCCAEGSSQSDMSWDCSNRENQVQLSNRFAAKTEACVVSQNRLSKHQLWRSIQERERAFGSLDSVNLLECFNHRSRLMQSVLWLMCGVHSRGSVRDRLQMVEATRQSARRRCRQCVDEEGQVTRAFSFVHMGELSAARRKKQLTPASVRKKHSQVKATAREMYSSKHLTVTRLQKTSPVSQHHKRNCRTNWC